MTKFQNKYFTDAGKLRGDDIFRQEFTPTYLVYRGQDDASPSVKRVALRTYLSGTGDHFVILWGGYDGNIMENYHNNPRIQNLIPEMLYMTSGATPGNPSKMKYISLTGIYSMESVTIAREVIEKFSQAGEQATTATLHFTEIASLAADDPRRIALLAICGIPEMALVSKFLNGNPEALSDQAGKGFLTLHIFMHHVISPSNIVRPALTVLVELAPSINLANDEMVSNLYRFSVLRGAHHVRQIALIEADLDRVVQSPDLPPKPLPDGIDMDFSWSGGQEYPFSQWVQSLTPPAQDLQYIFLRSGRSYKKVHLRERLGHDRSRIVFWSTVSAKDKHMAYWWTPSTVDEPDLVDWIYHCWVTGSNFHFEPGTQLLNEPPSKPGTNLKYITIWGIKNPETITILQEIFKRLYPDSRPEDIIKQGLSIRRMHEQEDRLKTWAALSGIKEILDIYKMCLKYRKGLMGAYIISIDIQFEVFSSLEDLRVFIVVGLHTDGFLAQMVEHQDPINSLAEQAAAQKVSFLGTKRLRIQTSYVSVRNHPYETALHQNTQYKPSGNPSYTPLDVLELPGSYPEYPYKFGIDTSSQENHICLRSIKIMQGNPAFDLFQHSSNQYLDEHLGEVMFSTWFAQEGWSKIRDVTFARSSDTLWHFVAIILGDSTGDISISIPNDGGDDFNDILNFFFENTLEGKSIQNLAKNRAEFLVHPEIQLLEVTSHFVSGEAQLLVFVRFGKQLQSNKDEPIDQVVENLLWEGIRNSRENKFAINRAIYADRVVQYTAARGYKYDPTLDRITLSKFQFRKNGEIKSPFNDLDPVISSKFQRSDGGEVDNLGSFTYFSTSVESKVNPLSYEIAASQMLGNAVVIHLPDEAQLPEQLSDCLTDAIYATWVELSNKNFKYKKEWQEKYPTRVGIRVVTFMELSPETKRVISEIRNFFAEEVSRKGFLVFQSASTLEDMAQVDSHPKSDFFSHVLGAKHRLWLLLRGTPEVSAVGNLYPKYQNQLEKSRHTPGTVGDISISWTEREGQEDGEKAPVLVVSLDAPKMDGNVGSSADENIILSSEFGDVYIAGDTANFCERYCGLGATLPDSQPLDIAAFQSMELSINNRHSFNIAEFKFKGLSFPWRTGLQETLLRYITRLQGCEDYSSVFISRLDSATDAYYLLEASHQCHHLVLDTIPRSTIERDNPGHHGIGRRELAEIYFEAWSYRFPKIDSELADTPVDLPFASLDYISIVSLSDETLKMLDFMGEIWAPGKVDLDHSVLPIIGSRYIRLFRPWLFHGRTQAIHAWNLLLGSLEIGAVADMIRLYPSSMTNKRIESIVIWPTAEGSARALVILSRANEQKA
ncbi:hypothetical protein TWF718_002395 [Orbilia javanica]|uniref:Uncharacterized protein n=1 Tax=Orbilia javanica TaxID=47235 RepID=A0AAN8MK11_9PEZI